MKIKSFAEACKILKYNPRTVLPNVSRMPRKLQAHTIARAKLDVIAEAAREGKELNYDDYSQYKYYPWFKLDKPGFRFRGTYYGVTSASAGGGPRLCYLTSEDAEYHGKKHLALYKAAMILPKKKAPAKKKK